MLRIKNISKNFGASKALKNVSFKVNGGEIAGLIGENGAGKSTLLRILSTVLCADSGSAEINGLDLNKQSEKIRQEIGILFGNETGLYERLTVYENLEFFARLYGISRHDAERRINSLAFEFEFEKFKNKYVFSLSKGMRQKAAIARAIVHDPGVMLFDEPDAGLDFGSSRIFFNFLESCKQKQKSIIFSSHSMENTKLYSDKIIVIRSGEIITIFDARQKSKELHTKDYNNFLFNLICGK